MKLTDKIIKKVGADKLLHFLISAYITLTALFMGAAEAWTAVITLIILSIWKEYKLDDYADNWDLIASALGIMMSVLIYTIIIWN